MDQTQPCSTDGCSRPAVYRTRSKPAWCAQCIDEILRIGGMSAVEPVLKPNADALMQCLACGTQAHHKLNYVVGNNSAGLATCRACHWRSWAQMQRANLARAAPSINEARAYAETNGYEYLGPLTEPSQADDPHHVRCKVCRRLSAERLGDIGFGCACSRNGKSTAKSTVNVTKARPRTVRFKDSGSAAVGWWDHDRNDQNSFATAPRAATRQAAWKCPDCSHTFTASIQSMVDRPQCPRCEAERRDAWHREYEALKRTMVADHPELAAAWADPADPATVSIAGAMGLYKFSCTNGHHPRVTPHTFLERGCPHCSGAESLATGRNPRLAQECPEIATQWHPTRNGKLTPQDVPHDSRKVVWWLDSNCGHEWEDPVRDRNKYQRYRCPQCRTILDSLAYQYPLLAREWSPRNPISAWQVRPHGKTTFEPQWVCSDNPDHQWTATLTSRTNGSDCPDCKQAGKSAVELEHYAAAKTVFGRARSGVRLRSQHFTRRPAWTVDIAVPRPDEQTLVIEYDGAYWHDGKEDVDMAKSRDLLAGGYRLVRLREHPLPPLTITNPHYTEIVVHASAPDPVAVIEEIYRHVTAEQNAP
ncbi:zinc-ribbon domain-containing protein [Nocardia jiangsuensis]|uniref:Zinc-ribbon domain-containing protein n=1 Tax=Nocardia jiangsuensis TaxID=1691563 RepID=A0ABV8DSS0_9NOCA